MQLYRIHNEDQSDKIEMIGATGLDMLTYESQYLETCMSIHADIYRFAEWLREYHHFEYLVTEDYHCNILT